MPIVRYRTRDITRILSGECPCGRTHRRIEAITHRTDDMLIINGVNVYPSQIEEGVYAVLPSATNYAIVIDERLPVKKMTIQVEVPPDKAGDKAFHELLEKKLSGQLQASIGLSTHIELMPMGELPPIQGKAKRVRFIKEV